MHSLKGAKAPRVVVPPCSEETGIPNIPYSSVEVKRGRLMTQAELEQTLRQHGYQPRSGRGSHIVWKHPERARTIAYHRRGKNYRVPDAVLADVRRQINKN